LIARPCDEMAVSASLAGHKARPEHSSRVALDIQRCRSSARQTFRRGFPRSMGCNATSRRNGGGLTKGEIKYEETIGPVSTDRIAAALSFGVRIGGGEGRPSSMRYWPCGKAAAKLSIASRIAGTAERWKISLLPLESG
jgi:hypothetical protein